MKLLLDTHVLLWLLAEPDRLKPAIRQDVEDRRTTVLLSAVLAWEIATKHAIGKLPLPESPEDLLARAKHDLEAMELPITGRHALTSASLPRHHNDPFDRLLVSQAIVEQAILITADEKMHPYSAQGVTILRAD